MQHSNTPGQEVPAEERALEKIVRREGKSVTITIAKLRTEIGRAVNIAPLLAEGLLEQDDSGFHVTDAFLEKNIQNTATSTKESVEG